MQRRNLLKAAGATGALPAVSSLAAASSQDDGQGGQECPRPNCIHPMFGYIGMSPDENVPSSIQPDHEVDLLIRPPDIPEDDDNGNDDDGNDNDDNGDDGGAFPEFFFEPVGLFVEQGDVVRFNLATPEHTITAYHPGLGRQRRVPEGVPAFSSPVLPWETFWLYRFEEPGVYDVVCAPHEFFGMVMRIVVGEPALDFGDPGELQRPPALTAALVLEDDAIHPENIANEGRVSWDDIADENKRILIELPEEDDDSDDDSDDDDNSDDDDGGNED